LPVEDEPRSQWQTAGKDYVQVRRDRFSIRIEP